MNARFAESLCMLLAQLAYAQGFGTRIWRRTNSGAFLEIDIDLNY